MQAAQGVQRTLRDAEEHEDEIDPQSELFPGFTGLVGAQGGLTALLPRGFAKAAFGLPWRSSTAGRTSIR